MKTLYESSAQAIVATLSNENMKDQIEREFISKMENCIKKNDLYIEVAYREIVAAKSNRKSVLILQPNFLGMGL